LFGLLEFIKNVEIMIVNSLKSSKISIIIIVKIQIFLA